MIRFPSKSSVVLALIGSLSVGGAFAQNKVVQPKSAVSQAASSNVDPSSLEGVTLKNGASSILVLANARIQKTSNTNSTNSTSNASNNLAPTFLRKIGAYEVHKATVSESAKLQAQGQSLPAFAQVNTGSDFVGVAYLNDTKELGLISKEVAAKFKGGQVPAQYKSRNPVELVQGSGLYVFAVADIYDWIRLVSRLQADTEVSLVEPQIKTTFASPR